MRYSKRTSCRGVIVTSEAFRDFSGLRESILSHWQDEQPPTGVEPSDRMEAVLEERGAAWV